jgi:hypothetical protein
MFGLAVWLMPGSSCPQAAKAPLEFHHTIDFFG